MSRSQDRAPLVVRFAGPDRQALVAIDPSGTWLTDGASWDLSIRWPLSDGWWTVGVAFPGEPACARSVFGCRRSGVLGAVGTFEVCCRIELDGPSWVAGRGPVDLVVDGSAIAIGPASDDRRVDLEMSMPWDLFVTWVADNRVLFGDLVTDQLVLDGSIAVLSTIDGALGLAGIGTTSSNVASLVRWLVLWEDATVRDQTQRCLAGRWQR